MRFPIAKILNFADGRLLTSIDDVYEFANYMTGDNLMTHQLPRAFREIKPVLEKQLPWLDSPTFKNEQTCLTGLLAMASDKRAAIDEWLKVQATLFGPEHEVVPLAEWMKQDPISELIQMREGSEGIIVVQT
jgi:hypothetical protein